MSRLAATVRRLAVRAVLGATVVTVCSTVTAAPAQAAADSWGAIALSPSTYRTGYTWDYPTAATATRAAAQKCGARDCRAIVEVANGCAALAQASNYALGWSYGGSRADAENRAIRATPGRHAHVVGWVCTANHR